VETVLSSKTKTVVISPEKPFVIIGERINPAGHKKLAEEMSTGDFSRVRSDALAQVEAGAHVLDVNSGLPSVVGADEPAIMRQAVQMVMETVDVPLCFDSPNPAALSIYSGKALINSTTAFISFALGLTRDRTCFMLWHGAISGNVNGLT